MVNKKDSGWISVASILFLFFITAMVSGLALIFTTSNIYFRKNQNDYKIKKEADILLNRILYDIQYLKEESFDSPENSYIISFINKYRKWNLTLEDVSSGLHLDFLPDSDLRDPLFSQYVFINNQSTAFINYRNQHGLSSSVNDWRPYVTEAAISSCVTFGWLHRSHDSSFAFKEISRNFSTADQDKLFPIVNSFPLININYVKPEIIELFILRPSFEIKDAREKYKRLKTRLEQRPLDDLDIMEILGVPLANRIFNYIGGKTAFWKITFDAEEKYIVQAIVAAVPNEKHNPRTVEKYVLLDRRFLNVR
ncbi:MAG: hypothetical protein FWC36_09050 [Spirochaetes bacterium]|nr:hypothetical protein [Spirochaetota bacterium]